MSATNDLASAIAALHPIVMDARRVLLTGPAEVDGDSIGATLALAEVLRRAHPSLDVVAASPDPVPARYRFLDGVDDVVLPGRLDGSFDVAFLLDGVRHRIGAVGPHFDAATTRVLVDHHRSSVAADYDLALLDPCAASTCDIVYELARHPRFDVAVDRPIAEALYTGVVFDTGTFRYSCTTPDTLRLAAALLETGIDAQQIIERVFLDASHADTVFRGQVMSAIRLSAGGRLAHACVPLDMRRRLGAGDGATDGLINSLIFIEGVEVAALLSEVSGGRVRISLRSRGRVNVAEIAASLSPEGGGHDRAAGVTLQGPLGAIHERVAGTIRSRLPRS